MPYLSCQPGIHVVGSHSVRLKVAGTESLIVKMQSGKTIDARCPVDFYGKIGERCLPCWTYETGSTTLKAATCTGNWIIRRNTSSSRNSSNANLLAEGNATGWGRDVALAPKGSDVFTGTEDPVALPGFQMFPPPECMNGGCLPDPALGSQVALPANCMASKKAGGNVQIPEECEEALVPGPFCHPYRFKGMCLETEPTVIECIASPEEEASDDFEFSTISTPTQITSASPRLVCPHILPCEPKEACTGGFNCLDGYVSYYTAFNNQQETLDPETGARVITTIKGNVCSPRHYTLPSGQCYAPRCGQCNPKTHFRLEGECAPCPEYPWLMPLILVAIALMAGLGMYYLTKKNVNLAVMSIGVDYFQVLGLFTRSRVKWPPEIKWLFQQFQWAMFDIDLTAPECAFRQFMNYENKFYVKLTLPLLGVTVIGLTMVLNMLLEPLLCPPKVHAIDLEREKAREKEKARIEGNGSKVKVMPELPKEDLEEESREESKEELSINPVSKKRGKCCLLFIDVPVYSSVFTVFFDCIF